MYTPSNRASKYVRQKLIELKREIEKPTTIVADFNIPLSEMDRFRRQKISKDIVEFNSTINQLDIIDIYRLLHPTMAEYTFFSSARETFTKTDHILSHKTHLYNFKEQKTYNVYSQTTMELN